MSRISMPARIIDALADCLRAKGINPIVKDDPPKNKTLEVSSTQYFGELGKCLKDFNQQVWDELE